MTPIKELPLTGYSMTRAAALYAVSNTNKLAPSGTEPDKSVIKEQFNKLRESQWEKSSIHNTDYVIRSVTSAASGYGAILAGFGALMVVAGARCYSASKKVKQTLEALQESIASGQVSITLSKDGQNDCASMALMREILTLFDVKYLKDAGKNQYLEPLLPYASIVEHAMPSDKSGSGKVMFTAIDPVTHLRQAFKTFKVSPQSEFRDWQDSPYDAEALSLARSHVDSFLSSPMERCLSDVDHAITKETTSTMRCASNTASAVFIGEPAQFDRYRTTLFIAAMVRSLIWHMQHPADVNTGRLLSPREKVELCLKKMALIDRISATYDAFIKKGKKPTSIDIKTDILMPARLALKSLLAAYRKEARELIDLKALVGPLNEITQTVIRFKLARLFPTVDQPIDDLWSICSQLTLALEDIKGSGHLPSFIKQLSEGVRPP